MDINSLRLDYMQLFIDEDNNQLEFLGITNAARALQTLNIKKFKDRLYGTLKGDAQLLISIAQKLGYLKRLEFEELNDAGASLLYLWVSKIF
jgi:hypothetical protein